MDTKITILQVFQTTFDGLAQNPTGSFGRDNWDLHWIIDRYSYRKQVWWEAEDT